MVSVVCMFRIFVPPELKASIEILSFEKRLITTPRSVPPLAFSYQTGQVKEKNPPGLGRG